jgi:hypothetical protein
MILLDHAGVPGNVRKIISPLVRREESMNLPAPPSQWNRRSLVPAAVDVLRRAFLPSVANQHAPSQVSEGQTAIAPA